MFLENICDLMMSAVDTGRTARSSLASTTSNNIIWIMCPFVDFEFIWSVSLTVYDPRFPNKVNDSAQIVPFGTAPCQCSADCNIVRLTRRRFLSRLSHERQMSAKPLVTATYGSADVNKLAFE
ncbi:hypothetical protein EVAR_46259_1 [Eumeta japonica]|uniref:Uncharacterized protein n=1 Tax=Eumeta variegata TaxID=151549 RepID=A0A4C1Y950_EUMVA|nr:hypothetical protein EVAR_46259_1 [Eumeta japonica]